MKKLSRNRELALALLFWVGSGGAAAAQWPAEVKSGVRVQARLPEQQYQMSSQRGQLIRGRVAARKRHSVPGRGR
jgi:hypothetical protein